MIYLASIWIRAWTVSLVLNPGDLWIGVTVIHDKEGAVAFVAVCVIPCLPIVVQRHWRPDESYYGESA